jgi:MFS family permease
MLYSTGIAPLISDLLFRYPGTEYIGFNGLGIALAIFIGVIIGFFLPAGMAHAPNIHKGYDHYSAAVPIGFTAFFLRAALYTVLLGQKTSELSTMAALDVVSWPMTNIFCFVVFGLCIIFAFILGCRPKDYWILLKDPDQVTSFSATYGNAVMLMNVGVYGLMILAYYNAIGVAFNGVTFGIIFCMLACCNSGSHPGNVWPIMAGYVVTSLLFGWISGLLGGSFATSVNAQAIAIGLCYANGLSPIADKYGWGYGMVAAGLHYLLVTSVPNLHGGFCLYNGGFTACLICLVMIPELERFFHTKQERKASRLEKAAK